MGDKKKSGKKTEKKEDPANEKTGDVLMSKRIGYEDMTTMENMTLDGVLLNLKDRYLEDLIYVSSDLNFIFSIRP